MLHVSREPRVLGGIVWKARYTWIPPRPPWLLLLSLGFWVPPWPQLRERTSFCTPLDNGCLGSSEQDLFVTKAWIGSFHPPLSLSFAGSLAIVVSSACCLGSPGKKRGLTDRLVHSRKGEGRWVEFVAWRTRGMGSITWPGLLKSETGFYFPFKDDLTAISWP